MIVNRSVPHSVVIPVLTYEDVAEASEWLCRAFGFKERLRVGNHRVQLVFGDDTVIITAGRRARGDDTDPVSHAVHVRIDDADRHHEQAKRSGARIIRSRRITPTANGNTAPSTSRVTTGRSRNRLRM